MAYNRKIHHRRSIRLKGHDYTDRGRYFITICTHGRKRFFGQILNDRMILNDYGKIAYQHWKKLPERFKNMVLDVFQIMPDHMHGIITLTDVVGATLAVAPTLPVQSFVSADASRDISTYWTISPNDQTRLMGGGTGASPAPTHLTPIGAIVGAYKSVTANDCLNVFKNIHPGKLMGKLWQRNYFEHIIRDEEAYHRIAAYIIDNPKNE